MRPQLPKHGPAPSNIALTPRHLNVTHVFTSSSVSCI
jgi:hypothetical protein